jgi:DNA-binding NarL/FixJ family response regulator
MAKCILIVDDSYIIRKFVHEYFETQTEFSVCGEAVDGLDAIDKARELCPDLIILDASMPRMSGLQAAPILRSMDQQVPIILFTMHAEAVAGPDVLAAGITSVISKTENIAELSKCVRQHLLHLA